MAVVRRTDHWPELAQRWHLSGSPLRPSNADIALYRAALADRHTDGVPPRVLLLGVTPELYGMGWPNGTDFVAADRSQAMIEVVWPGARDLVRCEDWTDLSVADASRDIVLCDGGFHLLAHPEGQAALVDSIGRVLAGDGLCVFRLFVPPAQPESPERILRDLLSGRIPNVDSLKMRLAMALQDDPRAGVALAQVWETFSAAVPELEDAQPAIGWPIEKLTSIDAYRGSPSTYHFVGVEGVSDLFRIHPGGFELDSIQFPDYELGERCPIVAFRRMRR